MVKLEGPDYIPSLPSPCFPLRPPGSAGRCCAAPLSIRDTIAIAPSYHSYRKCLQTAGGRHKTGHYTGCFVGKNADAPTSAYCNDWTSGLLDFWTSGLPDFWTSGLPDFWTSGLPDFCLQDFCLLHYSLLPPSYVKTSFLLCYETFF